MLDARWGRGSRSNKEKTPPERGQSVDGVLHQERLQLSATTVKEVAGAVT